MAYSRYVVLNEFGSFIRVIVVQGSSASMSNSSFPQRAVWPKWLPDLSSWLGIAGALLGIASIAMIGIPNLDLWAKVIICLISFISPIIARLIWISISVIWQRVKQYDFFYDQALNSQQLQDRFFFFLNILPSAGVQIFDVTGIEWGNRSPLLVVACSQQLPIGSKLAIVNFSTLDTLGQFEVVQPTIGGYLARENQIWSPVWWGFLHDELDKHAHPRVFNTVAVLCIK